jgi:hypothetical protein
MNLRSRAGSPCQGAAITGRSLQQGKFRSMRTKILAVGAVTAALALAAAGCSSGSSTPAPSSGGPGQRRHRGVRRAARDDSELHLPVYQQHVQQRRERV